MLLSNRETKVSQEKWDRIPVSETDLKSSSTIKYKLSIWQKHLNSFFSSASESQLQYFFFSNGIPASMQKFFQNEWDINYTDAAVMKVNLMFHICAGFHYAQWRLYIHKETISY